MNLLLNQELEYWNLIKYGIDNIGSEIKIGDIKNVFKGKAKVADDLDNMDVWMVNHAYLGQEHLRLDFEYDSFYGSIDFDLMPNKNSLKEGQTKRLVNFKAQIFGKNTFLWRIPLTQPKMEVYLNLKKQYGSPNNFSCFRKERRIEFEKASKLLRESLESFNVKSKDIYIWYIEKQEMWYIISFYYFKGNKEAPPFLSFTLTEMFKFEE